MPDVLWIEPGQVDYAEALAWQRELVARKQAGELTADVVLCLEHPPVITLGRQGRREALRVDEDFLRRQGVGLVPTERGGDVTCHMPGQLVLYPILDLHRRRLLAGGLVDRLEELMLRLTADCGVAAGRDARNRGVWIGDSKLGSLGVRISRGISSHGLALNVSNDLSLFNWVDPCGLRGVGMTSLALQGASPAALAAVPTAARRHFAELFDTTVVPATVAEALPQYHEVNP